MSSEMAVANSEVEPQVDGLPNSVEPMVLVVELPAEKGVAVGMTLACRGWRPIPLYNALPGPSFTPAPDGSLEPVPCVVEMHAIMAALWGESDRLAKVNLPLDAPPAFLLDANRRGLRPVYKRDFDNRSVSFPTDFPSANMLIHRGIRRALLIQESGGQPQPDLAHTLRRWQGSGIEIYLKLLNLPGLPAPLNVDRPPRFGSRWHRFLLALGLKTHPLGGFGGVLDETGSAG